MNQDNLRRTEEGRLRHDLSKKLYAKKKQKEKIEHEIQNGLDLFDKPARISDFMKSQITAGKKQVLITEDNEVIFFRKKQDNGYWFNNSYYGTSIYLHREKLKRHLELTEEQMKGYDVHHIDKNKDNNDLSNLQLLSKEEHWKLHRVRKTDSHRHVCKKCNRVYLSSVSKSTEICDKCNPEYAIGGSSAMTIKKICEYCGAEYKTKNVNRNRSKFCSNKCKSAYRRMSKIDDIEKICEYCGKTFKVNKYKPTKYCSSLCVGRAVTRSRRTLL